MEKRGNKMRELIHILQILWDNSRMFFGTVFVVCVIISFVLFLIEQLIYKKKRKKEESL